MALSTKRPSSSTTREMKKLKTKWEAQPRIEKTVFPYLKSLASMGKYKEMEDVMTFVLKEGKVGKHVSSVLLVTVESYFDNINKEVEDVVIKYMLKNDLKAVLILLKATRSDIKFKKYVREIAAKENIELKEEIKDKKEAPNKELSVVERLISDAPNRTQKKLNELYDLFADSTDDEWLKNKRLIMALFKISKNIKKYDDEKAQTILDYCIKAYPSNGSFNKFNNLWNPVEAEDSELEQIEQVVEIIEDDEVKQIIPIEKQIYTEDELVLLIPNLKSLNLNGALQKAIEEESTKYRKDRTKGAILISFAKDLSKSAEQVGLAVELYEIIKDMRNANELRSKEIKQANILWYDILVTQEKFDEADEWNDNQELGFAVDGEVDSVVELSNTIAQRDDAHDLFYQKVRSEAIMFYRKTVDSYINNGQFKHKLGAEVSDVVIDNIKDKIAIDLQYLDFEIREQLIPYFIKVEANAKIVLKQYRNVIGHLIDKGFNDYSDELRFVLDVSKLKEEAYSDQELFQRFVLAFRALRNHMVHGSPNMFALRIYEARMNATHEVVYDEAISFFEETGNVTVDDILAKAEKKVSGLDLFKLPIVQNVLSYDAIENHRGFGLALIMLFITTPRYTFLRIASEIDHKINIFKNRTVLGSKNKLYEALGLKPDWIKALSEIDE